MTKKIADAHLQTLGMTGTTWNFFVAAVNLFSIHGYANVSIRDIASTLNIKAASMYNHFDSKDALLVKIYDFCQYHFDNITANLDGLVEIVPKTPPQKVFDKYLSCFGDEIYGQGLLGLMPKVLKIVLEESTRDKRAEKLANILYNQYPNQYLKPILQKMIELGQIKPIDVNLFITLYSSFEMNCSRAQGSKLAISGVHWKKCRKFLFSLIQTN